MEETTDIKDVLTKLKSSLPICRVCLDVSMEYIEFEGLLCVVNNQEITYAEGFFEIAPDMKGFPAPSNFCVTCGKDLLNAYLFIKRVENANFILNKVEKFTEETSDCLEKKVIISDVDTNSNSDDIEIEIYKNHSSPENLTVMSIRNDYPIKTEDEDQESENFDELDYQTLSNYEMSETNELQNEDFDSGPGQTKNESQSENELDGNDCTEWILSENPSNEHISTDDYAKNCYHCEKLIPNEELETHLLLHEYSKSASCNSDEETHECNFCKTTCKDLEEFLDHIQIHKDSEPQNCDVCSMTFDTKFALAFHKLRLHNSGKVKKKNDNEYSQCKKCKRVVQKSLMHKHLKGHSMNKNFSCFSCEEPFSTKLDLQLHKSTHKNNQFTCNICGKICLKSSTLIKHIQYIHLSERRKYQCEDCGLFFQFPSYLKDHQRKHDTKSRFHCSQCDRSFCRKPQLDIHMRYHMNDFPYKCDKCDKCYVTKSNLMDHIKAKHTKTTFDCDKCIQKFKSQTGLRKHKYTHDGYPYSCPFCYVGQTSRSGFKTHLQGVHKDAITEEEFNERFPIIIPKTGFRRPKDK